ncbi:MAG: PepSY domain-containing protein [Rhodobacter sp.]|nr:PepSY domain-containing protein [Rhodobacter sp.]MBS3980213.1 PepSY domain-containing protein [Paracoccaceae bacterium]
MLKSLLATAALIALGTAATAQVTAEGLVARYQAEGHDRIEVAVGPTQIEVGTIRDGIKTETVYDRATGSVLERESGPAGNYRIDRGVEIETSGEDFVGRDDDDDRELASLDDQHDRDQDARDDQHDRDQDARDDQHDREQDARDDQHDRDQDARDDN